MEGILFNLPYPTFEERKAPTEGLIAEYLFNNNTDDTSLSGYNLTNSGITFENCDLTGFEKCGAFNGTSSQAVANAGVFPTSAPLTLCVWLNPTSTTIQGEKAAISTSSATVRRGYALSFYGGNVRFAAFTGSGHAFGGTIVTPITANTWQFIVVTWNGAIGGEGKIRNVSNNTSATLTATGTVSSNNSNFKIGDYQVETGYRYAGKMAGLRIYNRVLTDSEISTLYNGGKGI